MSAREETVARLNATLLQLERTQKALYSWPCACSHGEEPDWKPFKCNRCKVIESLGLPREEKKDCAHVYTNYQCDKCGKGQPWGLYGPLEPLKPGEVRMDAGDEL